MIEFPDLKYFPQGIHLATDTFSWYNFLRYQEKELKIQELERGLSKREEEITRRENQIMETAKQGEDRLVPSLIYVPL